MIFWILFGWQLTVLCNQQQRSKYANSILLCWNWGHAVTQQEWMTSSSIPESSEPRTYSTSYTNAQLKSQSSSFQIRPDPVPLFHSCQDWDQVDHRVGHRILEIVSLPCRARWGKPVSQLGTTATLNLTWPARVSIHCYSIRESVGLSCLSLSGNRNVMGIQVISIFSVPIPLHC